MAGGIDVLTMMQRRVKRSCSPLKKNEVESGKAEASVIQTRNSNEDNVEIGVTNVDTESDDDDDDDDNDDNEVELLSRAEFEEVVTQKVTKTPSAGVDKESLSEEKGAAKRQFVSKGIMKKENGSASDKIGSANPSTVTPMECSLQKELDTQEKEKKKQFEKEQREKAKQLEMKLKKQKRIAKQEERRKKEEHKLRIKKENELKREQLKKDREERERKKQEEKEERERKRIEEKEERERKKQEDRDERERKKLEEKLKKEEERKKLEEIKKQEEESRLKQKQKLQIFNFFKTKTVVKSTLVETPEASNIEEDDEIQISEFSRAFNDFYIKEGTSLFHFHTLSALDLKKSILNLDSSLGLNSKPKPETSRIDSLEWLKALSEPKPESNCITAQYVYENELEGTSIVIRFIKFYENFKPYYGTYTKPVDEKLAIDPFKGYEDIFYDFDDEGDENEEGEGEDIEDLDDEEEEEEDEDEDIDDFLEQDSTPSSKAKIIGPLIPKVSWNSENEKEYRIEILKENINFPICPKRNYWEAEHNLQVDSLSQGQTSTLEDSTPPKPKKPKAVITDRKDLETLAQNVNQSDYTIPTMVEMLKKQLPNYSKATIKNTLEMVAKRIGPKATERKWEVNTERLIQLGNRVGTS